MRPWSLNQHPFFVHSCQCHADFATLRSGNRQAAGRREANEFPARHSRSFARRRRPVRAKVRSTTRRRGRTAKPLGFPVTSTGSSETPACRSRARGFGPEHPLSAKIRARAGAAPITSGAPSRSCTPAGCTLMEIGDPRRLPRHGACAPGLPAPSRPRGPPFFTVFADRLSTAAAGSVSPGALSLELPEPFQAVVSAPSRHQPWNRRRTVERGEDPGGSALR